VWPYKKVTDSEITNSKVPDKNNQAISLAKDASIQQAKKLKMKSFIGTKVMAKGG
jgi:hypothetical protein